MPYPSYLDTPTKFGGIVRIFPDGSSQVIKRDFGLTTEPWCSEEAHAQMKRWLEENMPWVFMIPVEAITPGASQPPLLPPPPPPP
jgi:hypothetical protein